MATPKTFKNYLAKCWWYVDKKVRAKRTIVLTEWVWNPVVSGHPGLGP